jgi:glycosyltransferase A (GT-A) superfamily protein (DUF2064 family)
MHRYVVLFAREPAREAREKGFGSSGAADLFAAFAAGWLDSAASVGATLVIASPPEDRSSWRRRTAGRPRVLWLAQQGRTFGERLEHCGRAAARFRGRAVVVGGDVSPDRRTLEEAFIALERGADAALAPSPDGGVSLVGLHPDDLDLLGGISCGDRDVFATLHRRLSDRGRRVAVVSDLPDVDGRRGMRLLVRDRACRADLAHLARRLLASRRFARPSSPARVLCPHGPDLPGLRAPPPAA